MFENNIKQHYVDFVERLVNVFFDKKKCYYFLITKIFIKQRKEKINNEFCKKLRELKHDLLNVENTNFKSTNHITIG